MKLALIPPNTLKESILDGTINLLLPWQMKQFPADFVRTALETYTILDNGAAEGALASLNELERLAWAWAPNELVIPDRFHDWEFTVSNAEEIVKGPFKEHLERGLKLMGVVQGNNLGEIMACVNAYMGMEHVHTIGLPRQMNFDFGQESRLRLVESLQKHGYVEGKEVHCLGSYYPWPREIRWLADFPIVRSMDTSLPWVFGWKGRYVNHMVPKEGVARPENYFNSTYNNVQREASEHNVRCLLQWAKAPRH